MKARPYLLLTPLLLVLGGIFVTSFGLTLQRSFRYMPAIGLREPDLAAYQAILSAPGFLASLTFSLWVAAVSAVVSAALGLGAALLLRRAFAGRGLLHGLLHLVLTVPHIVGAIGVLYLFSQSGIVARLAFAAGMIDAPREFFALTQDSRGIGIILTYVWKEVPFVAFVLLARLGTIGTDHEATARCLGASPWQTFAHVLMPMLGPALIAATALVFAFAFAAHEEPLLLGAHAPEALSVLVWKSHTDVDLATRPEAMAMAMAVALVAAAILGLVARLLWPVLAPQGRMDR